MATYRCPVCGASHKQEPKACRLCGYRMGEEIGTLITTETGTKPLIRTKGGFKRPMIAAIIGVAIIAGGAVALGAVRGDSVEDVGEAIPFLDQDTPDGWAALSVPEVDLATEFPKINEPGTLSLSDAEGGELTTVEADAGEIHLIVGHGTVGKGGDDHKERLRDLASGLGLDLDDAALVEDVSVRGLPALQVQVDHPPVEGSYSTTDDYLILKGDDLILLRAESPTNNLSAEPEPPEQLERIVGKVRITGS
jgi:hypothetical protein